MHGENFNIKPIFTNHSPSGLRITLLLALAIILMIVDQRFAAMGQVRSVLSTSLAPLQYIVSYPIQWVDALNNIVSSHNALVKENMDLKGEQLILKAQVQRLLAIEGENNQLKSLMSSASQVQGKVLVAQLLAVANSPFVNQVTLDRGSKDNVFVGQPVLDATGVMGQVIEVYPFASRVLLINDIHSGVPVQIVRNGVRAIAVGEGYSGQLRLINLPQTADVRIGDTLITSGLGEHYPEGYPIGSITHIKNDPGLPFALITVEPAAHLDRSRVVLLIWSNHHPIRVQ